MNEIHKFNKKNKNIDLSSKNKNNFLYFYLFQFTRLEAHIEEGQTYTILFIPSYFRFFFVTIT